MSGFLALFKVSFRSMLLSSVNTRSSSKRKLKATSGTSAVILLAVIMAYISGMYSFMLAEAFGPGGLNLMLLFMSMLAMFFPIVFILFAAQGTVFSTKDVDLVLSLPISSFSVLLARVSALYVEALLITEMLLIPAGVAYVVKGGAGGPMVVALLVVLGVFLAMVPTFLSLVFGSLISLLISRIKHKNLFNVIFSLLLFVALMAGIFAMNFGMAAGEEMGFDIAGIYASVAGGFPPADWIVQGALGSGLHILFVVALGLLPLLAAVWVFSRVYKGLLTRLASTHLRSDFKLRGVKASGSFRALFAKETRKFFGTPSFVINNSVMIVMLIIGSVAAVIFRSDIQNVLGAFAASGAGEILDYLPPILLAIFQFFASFIFVSCVSISLEGKTLWILKEAPLGTGKIFAAKAGFQFLLGAFTTVVCIPLLGWGLGLQPLDVLLMALLTLLFALFTATSGLFINLLFPRMDAENDTMVIKNSTSVMVTMLFNVVVLAAFVGLFFLMQPLGLGFAGFGAAAALLLAALDVLAIALLNTKGRKMFARL